MNPENKIKEMMDEVYKQISDLEERRLIKICEENNFVVNNQEVKRTLQKILPEGTTIYVEPRINPREVIMIKKFVLDNNYSWKDI